MKGSAEQTMFNISPMFPKRSARGDAGEADDAEGVGRG